MTEQTEQTEQTIDDGDVVAQIQLTPPVDGDQQPTDTTPPEDAPVDANAPEDATQEPEEDPESFPREYVQKLRQEAADARVKAKDRDDIAGRLHTAMVAATGRLADPTDLPFDEANLDDPEALRAAIDALLEAKPHLASRKPVGDVGQGNRGSAQAGNVDLAAILRSRAG